MFNLNICQQIYPILLIKSIGKKSFQALGEVVNKTGKTVRGWICSGQVKWDTFFKEKWHCVFQIP